MLWWSPGSLAELPVLTKALLMDNFDEVSTAPAVRLRDVGAYTLHYRLSPQHLPYDLDEFTFRFNRRKSKARGMLFYAPAGRGHRSAPAQGARRRLSVNCTQAEMQDLRANDG